MTTIDLDTLTNVTGGVGPQARCNRAQFDWMASHMVPDGSMKPGVQRHVVAADARACGFPMPRR
jgi:hypothetical protein